MIVKPGVICFFAQKRIEITQVFSFSWSLFNVRTQTLSINNLTTQYIGPLFCSIFGHFLGKYKNENFYTVIDLPYKQACNSFLTRMFVESLYDFSVYIELKEISFFLSLYSGLDILADEVGSEPKIKATR